MSTDPQYCSYQDRDAGIGRLTLNNADRGNSYDPAMRDQMAENLDDLADDDDIKVVLLRVKAAYPVPAPIWKTPTAW